MRILNPAFLVVFCLLHSLTIFGQKEKEDSLQHAFQHPSNDSLKLDAMLEYVSLTYNKYPEKSKKLAKEIIALAQKRKSARMEAGGNLILGMISFSESNYEQSIHYYLKSLEKYKLSNSAYGISSAYNNLGLVYNIQENLEKALEYYKKSLAYIDTSTFEGKDSYYATLLNVGVIHAKKKELKTAKKCFRDVELFYASTDDFLSQAYAFQTMGMISGEENDLKLVDEYFQKALNSVEKSNVPPYTISVLNGAAETYSKMNEHEKALYYALKADSVIKKHRLTNLYDLKNTKDVIARSNYNLGNYKIAYQVLAERIKISDSLYNIETTSLNQELIEKYESEKKQQEISLLQEKDKVNQLKISQKDSKLRIRTYFITALSLFILLLMIVSFFVYRQIKLKQQRKAMELENQALRAQMNPHFIFNALNSIQRMYLEGNLDKASAFMSDFAELMRKILDNSALNAIPLKEELKTLEYYMNLEKLRCQDKFNYSIHLDPTIDLQSTRVPPLVIQPFVENAIWHGILPKEGNGEIHIHISKERNKLKIEIVDNGIGFAPEIKDKHLSQGINLTEKRIGSRVNISSSKTGTKVSFSL